MKWLIKVRQGEKDHKQISLGLDTPQLIAAINLNLNQE